MRITCPNCDAQYEVPTSVIPADGRDVECSNCGKTWFQHHPDHMPDIQEETPEDSPAAVPEPEQPDTDMPAEMQGTDPEETGDATDEEADQATAVTPEPPAPEPAARKRRELDPGVADILREEAAREQAARKREPLEMQTDLNLDPASAPPPRPTQKARTEPDPDHDPNSLREPTSRRQLLPDIEEINSTLRSTADRDAAGDDPSPDAPIKSREKRGFRRGFVVSVALIAIAALVYSFAPEITQAVPQAGPALDSYTSAVDDARIWLNGQVTTFTEWLETQAAASQS